MPDGKSFRTGLDSGWVRHCVERFVQLRRAGDGCQRPLVPRSRCQQRLTPSVRRLGCTAMEVS